MFKTLAPGATKKIKDKNNRIIKYYLPNPPLPFDHDISNNEGRHNTLLTKRREFFSGEFA